MAILDLCLTNDRNVLHIVRSIRVFVRDDAIEGIAPSLTLEIIEI